MEEQRFILEDLEGIRSKLFKYDSMESFVKGNSKLDSIVIDMDILINTFVEVQDQDMHPASVENSESLWDAART